MMVAVRSGTERVTCFTRWRFSVILGWYLLAAGCFAFLTPPFEAPDETGHLFYINQVAKTGSLPNQDDSTRAVVGEGHQFPLYYIIGAIPVRLLLADDSVDLLPVKNRRYEAPDATGRHYPKFLHLDVDFFAADSDRVVFYLLRGYSIALGALTLLLTFRIAALIQPGRVIPLLATVLVATLPQFLFITASVNNDNLVTLAATATIYTLLRLWEQPSPRMSLILGGTLGVALLAKKSALFLVPAVAFLWCVLWLSQRDQRRTIAYSGLAVGGIATLISGWVFLRNHLLYGDPLGTAMERRTLPELVDEQPLWSSYWLDPFLPRIGESFFGVFGWMNVFLPRPVYWCALALAMFGIVGLVQWMLVAHADQRPKVGFLILLIGLCLTGVVYYNLTYTQYQGRFLFPVIAPIAVLGALALNHWIAAIPGVQLRRVVLITLVAAFIAIDVLSLIVQWQFHYREGQYL